MTFQRRKAGPQSTTPPRERSASIGNANGVPVTVATGSSSASPNRPRIHSHDRPDFVTRSQQSSVNRLMPFELARSWAKQDGDATLLLLAVYVGGILAVEIVWLAVLDDLTEVPVYWSWTVTHLVHLFLSVVYLHWLKGSVGGDDQGELAALTLWEQMVRVQPSRALAIVPTLLCYAACHFGAYRSPIVTTNLLLWSIHVIAKSPAMLGTRLFGINRTPGIDDELAVPAEKR